MKIVKLRTLLVLCALALLSSPTASAIQGNYADAGGGEYWGRVWVSHLTPGYSFNLLIGKLWLLCF